MTAMSDNLRDMEAETIAWRRHIHANPETAFEEYKTAGFVAEKLREFGLKVTTGLAKTGVVGTLSRGEGPSIALRADMDGLYMQEKNIFAHRSQQDGKMHACGHDGHTAMLLAAARYLSGHGNIRGTVHFIFQPAEENEAGAAVMIKEGLFDDFPVDAVFGMHNWPGLAPGIFSARVGPQLAAFDTFEITLQGKGAHAAMPHLGHDPLIAAGQLVSGLQTITSRTIDPQETAVVSITQIHGGDTWNVIPDQIVIRGCSRHFSAAVQVQIEERMQTLCHNIAEAFQTSAELIYEKRYPAVINSKEETAFALSVVEDIGRGVSDLPPSMGSEDFAFMLQKKPGCYIFIGNGAGEGACMLHNPHYDFNDDILMIGARYWIALAEKRLPVLGSLISAQG